uniref:Uncharacterized protein n=1 Tax=Romanomermis culicivorax TaxID=13658 RepID=A0A915KDF1_ROMCU
ISEIRHFFEKYGTVEEIDIKTPQNGITAYAFVRFSDILSAREARKRCSGEYLRDNRCIIGWGKPIVTRRLWVGGFTSDISLSWLEKEFDRFGPVEKIDFNRGETHAFVLYADQRAATEAFRKLRGLRMKNGVLENVFHVDYADASMYERSTFDDRPRRRSNSRSRSPADRNRSSKRRRSNSGSRSPPPRKRNASSDRDRSPSKSGRRNKDSSSKKDNGRSKRRRSSSSASPHRRRNGVENNGSGKGDNVYSSPATQRQTGLVAAAEFAADSLQDLHEIRSPIWTGVLVLKKSAYPLQLFKMAGDDDLVDAYLRNERAESVQLNITQRYKLDQPRTGEILRVSASAMEHCAYLLAVPNPNVRQDLVEKLADLQSKHLKCLVEYFEDKNAAGVINLSASGNSNNNGASSTTKIAPQGVAYAFPHCTYADDFVATLCPKLSVWRKCKDECLLIVLQKSLTSQTTE